MTLGRTGWGLLALLGLLWAEAAAAGNSAVVFMYHRFGDSRYPSTNVRIEQLEAHIAELKGGDYTVLPVPEIISAIAAGRELPDRTVGITIDDAFLSVYREGWPRFRDAGIPVTLFVSTAPVDEGKGDYMTWDQIREMAEAGVVIGHHAADHVSFAKIGPDRSREQMARASARFEAELGEVPTVFAFPYGETSLATAVVVRQAGMTAAFGQHSGAFDASAETYYLPRFALNEKYGDMARFKLAANALPVPVTDVTPEDPTVTGDNPPAIGFTVLDEVRGLKALGCFASHEGKVETIRLGERRIEIRLTKPLPRGRSRINCTMPAGDGRWRWYGRQFFVGK